MQLETAAAAANLRFDRGLKSFPEIFNDYLETGTASRPSNRKIVAKGPLSPPEVIYAAGALAYDFDTHQTIHAIMSDSNHLPQQAVDMLVSSEFSPWLLVMLGASLAGQTQLPIDIFSAALGEFDDQLVKSFQLAAYTAAKPFITWEVPRYEAATESWAIDFLKKELRQSFAEMSAYTGVKVTDESLRAAIKAGNYIRQDMKAIDEFMALETVPVSGLEYYLVQAMLGDSARNPQGLHEKLEKLIDELQRRVMDNESAPGLVKKPVRIYVLGDESQELHLFNSIEDAGGVLVGCDFRLPLYYDLIPETSRPLDGLAEWIWHMPNNLPVEERIKLEIGRIRNQKPDALIISNVVGSRHLTGIERLVKDMVKRELSLPVLSIESTLPHENTDKIDYQINALMQTIGG
jgi:benzoyl-CoA reductase/2-hydroxyglutaryl-CoA dehydratase subunit BcrC/BadD/HgdB